MSSAIGQHAWHAHKIGLVYRLQSTEMAFSLGRLLGQNMVAIGLSMFVASRGLPETLRSAPLRFHLGHLKPRRAFHN